MTGEAIEFDTLPVVGIGPVATVHRLTGRPDEAPLAVKVFHRPADRFTLGALARERSVLGTLTQVRSILHVDELLVDPAGRPVLCGELCARSLGQLLAEHGPLPVPDALAIGQAVATALAAAHEVGLVHGAITPNNVLLRRNGEPVLADFGLAMRRGHRRDHAGTAVWAAPETVRRNELTELTDLYGLGAVLCAALTGRPPPAECDRADVPERLRLLVSRLLAPEPARRPVDAGSVLTELTAAARPSMASAIPAGGRAGTTPQAPPLSEPGEGVDQGAPAGTGRPKWTRPGTAVGVAAALAVLAAVPLLAARQPVAPPAQPGRVASAAPADPASVFTVSTVELRLDPPVDEGAAVELTWHGGTGLEYAVVIAGDSLPTRVVRVRGERTTRLRLEPARHYCFLVQGTDGVHVYQSAPRPIRGAVCTL